ncbi:MAG TPA: CpsD/CapB family tyrosine-protein kinase [Nevskiaceae bacterium]|nr:CpsD/CapB family tyrosine-protein kinase [Nevskiaceae bacterium]
MSAPAPTGPSRWHARAPAPQDAPAAADVRGRPAHTLVIAHDPADARSQRVRLLRTELMLRHEDPDQANAVAVLSPQRREGRSQLAAELAIACAQLGRPTLLVDADLHHPAQHRLFGVEDAPGLSEAIASGAPPRLVEIEGVPDLRLLPAGRPPVDALQLLSDRRFEQLLEQWHTAYDFLVVDTGAAAQFASGLAVATLLGRVLIVSRAGHTPYRDTREMLRRVASTQARILGAVVSHF